MAAQAEADAAVVTTLINKYSAQWNVAQGEVNETREAHGKNFVHNAVDSDDDASWDSDIEASSVGDAPSTITVDLSSDI